MKVRRRGNEVGLESQDLLSTLIMRNNKLVYLSVFMSCKDNDNKVTSIEQKVKSNEQNITTK